MRAPNFSNSVFMLLRLSKFSLLMLLLLFLNAQQALAVHAAEHNFHKHLPSCDVFIAAQSEQALTHHVLVPAVLPQHYLPSTFLPTRAECLTHAPFHARAPPVV